METRKIIYRELVGLVLLKAIAGDDAVKEGYNKLCEVYGQKEVEEALDAMERGEV